MTICFSSHGLKRLRERFAADERLILVKRLGEELSSVAYQRRTAMEKFEVSLSVRFSQTTVVVARLGVEKYRVVTVIREEVK